MPPTRPVVAAILLLAALAPLSMAAPAQPAAGTEPERESPFEYCGDVQPIFKNPDLQPQEDGYVHASGWFFIQFQVVADQDLTVDRLAFSFGKPMPDDLRTCDAPEWITDAYYKDYRVDDDPSDGFFIPINTTNVPDGEWAAAISVYSGGEEVGRGFTRALVENGCPNGYRDPDCPSRVRENDQVRPWPIVLPGDGEQVHGFPGLSIEFAEPVVEESVRAFVDGEEVPLSEMEPRDWDEDSVAAAADEDGPACPAPACVERPWGPAFQWKGELPEGAVIKVVAQDLSNNTVSKILHVSSTTVGGVISVQLPELEVKVPEANQQAGVGETARFNVTFLNVGRDVAHTNLHINTSDGLEATWKPNHVMVESGAEESAVLEVTGQREGTYELDAYAQYKRGAEEVQLAVPLTLQVGAGGNTTSQPTNNTTGEEVAPTQEGEGTPGPSAVVALLAGLSVAVLARRRRS